MKTRLLVPQIGLCSPLAAPCFALACILIGLLLDPVVSTAAQTRPNIVFIFSDDHALQAIGAYGSKDNRTPHNDRLAHEGAL